MSSNKMVGKVIVCCACGHGTITRIDAQHEIRANLIKAGVGYVHANPAVCQYFRQLELRAAKLPVQ